MIIAISQRFGEEVSHNWWGQSHLPRKVLEERTSELAVGFEWVRISGSGDVEKKSLNSYQTGK